MNQYFIENKNVLTNERKISAEILGQTFIFLTNNGLFSPDRFDYASRLLVENIPPLSGSLLDLGCGYGAIGITLASLYNINLTMLDINNTALEYAKKNIVLNGVQAEIILSDGFENVCNIFDTIVLNPPIHAGKSVMYNLYEQSKSYLAPNGRFYIVIQKKHGAKTSIERLNMIYDICDIIYKKNGFFVLEAVKKDSQQSG